MARTRTLSTIEAEIAKSEEELSKAKRKYDTHAEKLLSLQKQKQDYEAKQIIKAFRRSNRSLRELMTFSWVNNYY